MHWLTPQMSTVFVTAEGWSQEWESSVCLLCWLMECNYLSHPLMPLRVCISRKTGLETEARNQSHAFQYEMQAS